MIDLKSILLQYPDCLSSRTKFKAVLSDSFPEEKRLVNILTILYESGIASKIANKRKNNAVISENEFQGILMQFEKDYGIMPKYASEVVKLWADTLGVIVHSTEINSQSSPPTGVISNSLHKQSTLVTGNSDEYDIIQRNNGYFIAKFNGFDKEVMTLPNSISGKPIIGIAENAFKGCPTVKEIFISEGIEIIEDSAFRECSALKKIKLPNSLKIIGTIHAKTNFSSPLDSGAFQDTNLEDIVIPDSVYYIGPYTFNGCRNLRSIKLPNNLSIIHKSTFSGCFQLSTINFPSSLKKIEENAFSVCSTLTEIHLPIGTQEIQDNAFAGNRLTAVYIPPTVTKLGSQSKLSDTRAAMGLTVFGRKDNLTIYCAAGSVALEYARKYNIKYAQAQF